LQDSLSAPPQRAINKSWVDVGKARSEWETELQGAVRHDAEPIQSQFVAHMIRKVLPRNGLLVVDAGNGGKHVRSYFKSYEPGTFLCIDDWASVGGSFPIALGAKLARPDRPVLCASGDMGAMCNIGELETAMRENIPVVYVVFNDEGLGNERAFQNEHYGGRFYAVDYKNPDFGALAACLVPTANTLPGQANWRRAAARLCERQAGDRGRHDRSADAGTGRFQTVTAAISVPVAISISQQPSRSSHA
jgi:thiamine pyrophosphate-dependent acetolactate synthase large subunit-like protein